LARARVHLAAQPAAQGQPPAAGITGMNKLRVDTAGLNRIKMDSGQLALLHRQLDSINTALQKASSDSARTARLQQQSDSMQARMKKLQADTAQTAARIRSLNSVFAFTPDGGRSVVIVLNKVDPVYVTEARNAFDRFNTENYYGRSLKVDNASLDDSLKLVVIGSFENDSSALDYLRKARALSPREIIPWLPAGKYSFLLISRPNFDLLMTNKDLHAYWKFLAAAYQGKF
jgi:hypothetical protein